MKGIYLITNQINGKKYVGMSVNIDRRFKQHKKKCSIEKKTTTLTKAFKKYSIENFTFEVLEIIDIDEMLSVSEIEWISKLKPEYNMNDGGIGNKGYKVTDATKEKLSAIGKLQWKSFTEAEKQCRIKNLKVSKMGHPVSLETRIKLRNANLGKKYSEETKAKKSITMKTVAIGNKNGNKKVLCIKEGLVIKEYQSMVEAGMYLKIHPSNITKVLKGEQKTAAGYSWRYGV